MVSGEPPVTLLGSFENLINPCKMAIPGLVMVMTFPDHVLGSVSAVVAPTVGVVAVVTGEDASGVEAVTCANGPCDEGPDNVLSVGVVLLLIALAEAWRIAIAQLWFPRILVRNPVRGLASLFEAPNWAPAVCIEILRKS